MKKYFLAAALALASLLSSPARAVTATVTGYVGVTNGTDPRLAQTFSTPAGETGQINIVVKNANGSAYDLTGAQQLLLTVRDRNNAVIISHQATINSPSTAGTAFFPLVVADTVGLSAFGDVGYSYDIWVTDSNGNRWAAVKTSIFSVTRAQGQPAQPVTVPATQTPLAQGPQGFPVLAQNGNTSLTPQLKLGVDGTLLQFVPDYGNGRILLQAPGLAATSDARFLPTPSTSGSVYVVSDSGSAYTATQLYPTVSGEVGVTSKLYPVGDARRYGAVGDWNGSSGTNNRTAIQNAITSANAVATVSGGQAVVQLPCGSFMVGQGGDTISYSLYGLSNVTVQGMGDCTIIYGNIGGSGNFTHKMMIGASGYWTDYPGISSSFATPWQNYPTTGRLTTNVVALGANTLTANPTGGFATVVAGDWLDLNEGAYNGGSQKWDFKVTRVQVKTVAGDTVTLTAPVDIAFTNSSGLGVGVFRITPVQNFWIRKLQLQGTANDLGIEYQTTVGGGVDDVTISNTNFTAKLWYANDTHFFTLKNSRQATGAFGGFNRASHGLVDGNRFESMGAFPDGGVEFGQGETFATWRNNNFRGIALGAAHGAIFAGGQCYFATWENNIIAADGTADGVVQVKGCQGFAWRKNIIQIGGAGSYVFQVVSSDATNTGVASTEADFSENIVTADAGASAPTGAVLYLGGNPQVTNSRFVNNRINAPSSWPLFKITNPNTTSTLNILGNQQSSAPSFALLADDTAGNYYPSTDGTASTGGTLGLVGNRFKAIYTFNLLAGNAPAVDVAANPLVIQAQAGGAASAATGKTGGAIQSTSGTGGVGAVSGAFNGGTGGAYQSTAGKGGDGTSASSPGAGGNWIATSGTPGAQGSGGSGNGNSGFFQFNVPAPTNAGSYGQYQFQFGGTNHLNLNQTDTLQFALATGNKTLNIVGAAVDTAGVTLTISGQQGGTASATGGGAGGALTTAAGQGGTATAALAAGAGGVRTDKGGLGGTGVSSTNPGAGGQHIVAGGDAGTGGGGNANGGELDLRGGALSGTGTAGKVKLGDSNTSEVDVAATSGGKVGFFNVTAVVQQNTTGTNTGFTAGAGTTVTDQSTFTGGTGATAYRISDVVLALKHYGLLAP